MEKKKAQENYKWESLSVKPINSKGRKSSTHKYDIETSNHEKRREQMQHMEYTFEIKRPELKTILYLYKLLFQNLLLTANQK